MDGAQAIVRFIGDLEDPWVDALLKSIEIDRDVVAVPCPGELPDRPFDLAAPPSVVVLHRWRLSHDETTRLERWRPQMPAGRTSTLPRLVLCHGPMVRHEELERCARIVDLLIPEATASETLAKNLRDLLDQRDDARARPGPRALPVEVVSTDHALRSVLAESCAAAGYRTTAQHSPRCEPWRDSPATPRPDTQTLTVWDVPVLEPDWPRVVKDLSLSGPVVTLLGFADRATVRLAREQGASACLDVPFQLDDLVHVIDRLAQNQMARTGLRGEPGHVLPVPPAHRAARGREAIRNRETGTGDCPQDAEVPRMTL